MIILIIIFAISILSIVGMLSYQAWQIQISGQDNLPVVRKIPPEIHFRQIEKFMLYFTKHIVQSVVLFGVKCWFKVKTRVNKWVQKNTPRVHEFFKKKETKRRTFVSKAILESKIKIRRIKEKIEKEVDKN